MPSSLGVAGEISTMEPINSSQSNQSSLTMYGCDENGKCIVNESGLHDQGKNSKCWIFGRNEKDEGDEDLLLTSGPPNLPTQSSGINDDSFTAWDDDDDIITAISVKQKNQNGSSESNQDDRPPLIKDIIHKQQQQQQQQQQDDEDSDLDEPRKRRGLNSKQVREMLERDDPPPDVDVDADDILNRDIDDDDDMDVGRIKAEYLAKMGLDEPGDTDVSGKNNLNKKDLEELLDNLPKPVIQKPLQPGSSPEEENIRFLCWNTTGIIRAQYGEDQCIDVMFHDSEKHSSVNFRNEPNYSFGSLSDDVIVMGTNGQYGTGPAVVFGINLLEIDREQREWQINLPNVELIESLAAGSGFVAVVTDKRYLRLLTHGGMQSYVLSLPGQVLCMNAHEQQLLIIYHNGWGHPDDQNLSMATYQVDLLNNNIVQTLNDVPVALSKRSPLSWAGFSDEGVPATSDYHGIVRVYKEDIAKSWHPVLDFKEISSSALDHYFVVGLSELRNGVRAVKCSKSRYPDTSEDVATFYEFTIPLCDMDCQKVQLEEEHIRLRLAKSSFDRIGRQSSQLKRIAAPYIESNVEELAGTLLKLFSIYLNDSKEEAAKNIVFLMPKEHVYKLPEYAWHTKRRTYFIESLTKAIEDRERYDSEQQNNDEKSTHHTIAVVEKEKEKEIKNDHAILKPKPLEVLKDRQDFTIGPNGQLLRKKRKNVDDDDDDDEDDVDDVTIVRQDDDMDENINNDDSNDSDVNIVKKPKKTSRIAMANGKTNPFKRKR